MLVVYGIICYKNLAFPREVGRMNLPENSSENNTLKVEDLLEDIRSGMNNEDLLAKYNFSKGTLERLGEILSNRSSVQGVAPQNGDWSPPGSGDGTTDSEPEKEASSFICPSCLTSYDNMFDICPACSASFQETMAREMPVETVSHDTRPTREIPSSGNEVIPETQDAPTQQVLVSEPVQPRSLEQEKGPSPIGARKAALARTTARGKKRATLPNSSPASEKRAVQRPPDFDPDRSGNDPPLLEIRCESCGGRMAPALRDIYDRSRSVHAISASAVCLVLGYVGSVGLSLIDTPSVLRLTVFYITAILLLLGAVFTAVGVFMFLAREKVYFCSRCKRTHPRADIAYLAAALVWSSRKAARPVGWDQRY